MRLTLRRLIASLTALVLLAAPAARSAGAGIVADRTLRLSLNNDPHALQPLLEETVADGYLANLAFDQLLQDDRSGRLVPDLATEVPTVANHGISADGTTIVVHLHHDVRWQDGAPFTADDVVFTMHAVLDPHDAVANRVQYDDIASVRADDPYTVTFHLKRRQASFPYNVLDGYPIVPAHLLAKSTNFAHDPFNAHPVGTGPYRFVRWVRGDHVEYDANPGYFRGVPKIQHVRVDIVTDPNTLALLLRQHQIDLATVPEPAIYDQLRGVPDLAHARQPANEYYALALNAGRAPLDDIAVRRAIVAAIDRVAIARTATFGTATPAYADMPFWMYGGHAPAGWDRADPAAAAAMLDADGWKIGPDGVRMRNGEPLRLDAIAWSSSAQASSIMLQTQQMLARVGIALTVKTYPLAFYYARPSDGGPFNSDRFDLALEGFAGGPDPSNDTLYTCANRAPAGYNVTQICDPALDRLEVASEGQYDDARRRAIVAQIEDLAVHDAGYVFLYHDPSRFIYNPALRRPPPSIDNPWFDIQDWNFAH